MISTSTLSQEFSSTEEATELIELYTSEGCSSCPSADKWLTQLKSHPQLFKKFIPLGFHVDYWNQLGWTDRFSKKQYSQRQYQHQREGNISQVYTPGFVVNNEEWRSWRLSYLLNWPDSTNTVGVLKVNYQPNLSFQVTFTPQAVIDENQLVVNIALLGMSLSNEITLGENRGHKLRHDFVVLNHYQQQVSYTQRTTNQWQFNDLSFFEQIPQKTALVVWLSRINSQDVIQATGGYI